MLTDGYLNEALLALQIKLPFRYKCLYSREPLVDTDPRYVQNALSARDIEDAVVLAAGAPEMVRDARNHCLALGLPEANFFADPFTSS